MGKLLIMPKVQEGNVCFIEFLNQAHAWFTEITFILPVYECVYPQGYK